jgi:hypothetical protein
LPLAFSFRVAQITIMSSCCLAGEIDKPYAGRHEDGEENYICSSPAPRRKITVIPQGDFLRGVHCDFAGHGLFAFAKNIRFYQVGVERRDAEHGKKPVVYCCFVGSHLGGASQKQILWPKATSCGARFAQDDSDVRSEYPLTTSVVKNHRDPPRGLPSGRLPWFQCSRSIQLTKKHRFSMVLGWNPCAPHKSAPCRPATLQIHDAARNLLTSLGVRRHGVPFGEKNPWNLMRIMPPQGSVEVSHRSCHGSRFFPPFLRSLFMERT